MVWAYSKATFRKQKDFFFFKVFRNRLINYFMAWAWEGSSAAWPLMMSHLRWAYIVDQSVSEKDREIYCKLFLFSDFLNKLLLATVQKLKVICTYWQQKEKGGGAIP